MSLLSAFLEALRGDPPLNIPLAEKTHECRWAELERDCFKGELLKLGYTEEGLQNRVRRYARIIRASA